MSSRSGAWILAGNVETSVTADVALDTLHPDAIIDTPADGLVTSATVTPAAHSTDPSATLSATLDGVPFTLGSSVATEGVWTLVVTATDPAGNIGKRHGHLRGRHDRS